MGGGDVHLRAWGDLGGGNLCARKKIHNARMLEFCNRDAKTLILYKKEKRLQLSRFVKRF